MRTHTRSQTIQSDSLSTCSEPIVMTRSIRGSHCHHRSNRRGSSGDGSFSEKYRFSPVASRRFIGSRIQPLSRERESNTSSNDQARQEIEGLQFRAGDYEVYQNKRLTSTIPNFLQTSLRSIGELEFYDDEEDVEEDDDDEDDDDDDSLQFLETIPYTLTSSLRSAGMSIRSLPREIELLDQENFDHSSIRSGDDDFYLTATTTTQPTMVDLHSSLRTIDSRTLSLPREKELSHEECNEHQNQPQEKNDEGHEQESFATSKCISSSRVSFVQRGDTTNPHSQQVHKHHSQSQMDSNDALVEESLDDLLYKVYSIEVMVANMNENLVDMRRKVVSMESVVDTMNKNLVEMRQKLISVESLRSEKMVLYQPSRNKSLPIARKVLEDGEKPPRFPRAA